jgi:ribosomal protein L29
MSSGACPANGTSSPPKRDGIAIGWRSWRSALGMKSVLPEWYGHDDETIKQIITSGTIALDANAMLDLYRVGKNQREQIISVLEAVRDRIFVPYQAALEFHQNRLSTAGTNVSVYEKILGTIDVDLKVEYLNKLRDPRLKVEVREIVDAAAQDLKAKLAGLRDEHAIPFEDIKKNDPVLKALDELLDDQVLGKRPSTEDLKKLKATAQERYKDLIPPGYLDAKTKDDPTGDYLIWAELLEHAKTSKRPLLFVTSDKKEDWYRAPVRGQSLGPRVELIAEMRSVSKDQPYHQVPLDLFLDLANAYLDTSVERETIETVRSITRPAPVFDPELSKEWQELMQRVFEAAAPAGFPDLADAVAQRNWPIAASLSLDPQFQSLLREIRDASAARLYKQIRDERDAQFSEQARLATGATPPRPPTAQTAPQKNTRRKSTKKSAGKRANSRNQPKPSREKNEQ